MAERDFQPGTVLGGYRIVGYLGQGGCATVFEAERADGLHVALKRMHAFDPGDVAPHRFAREIALLTRLRHPNVVPLLDYGQGEDEVPFLVLELLAGVSLKEAIRDQGPFDVARTGRVALQVLDALAAAHALGIVHRDIKPANIFVCRAPDGSDLVRVLDFGLGKALVGDAPDLQTLTRTGFRVGTPRYMSPEMARGQRAAEPGDLYGLALVIAEMLHGKPLVTARASIEVMLAHSSPEPLPLPESVTRSPLHRVIARGLAKPLDIRYRTALQMRADLEACLGAPHAAPAHAAPDDDEAPPPSQGASFDLVPTALFRPPEIPSAGAPDGSLAFAATVADVVSPLGGAGGRAAGAAGVAGAAPGSPPPTALVDPTLVEVPPPAAPRRRAWWWLAVALVPLAALAAALVYLLRD
ncbi:MAG: serine/threonine protein kinase [Polyangiaceae bacterium]|nr:serine/threonine protein kinase [Polyangiaceae bacterium]